MSKTIFFFLCISALTFFCSASLVKKCPDINNINTKLPDLNYELLVGKWFLVSNTPELNAKCKNVTIEKATQTGFTLHEEYTKKKFRIWKSRAIKDYKIVKMPQPSSILELKNKHWFSFGTKKYIALAIDDTDYLVLYRCSKGVFSPTKTIEIWSRNDTGYSGVNMPLKMKEVLTKINVNTENLHYRNVKDCLKK